MKNKENPRKIKIDEGEKAPLCNCGCNNPVKRKTYWPYTWNKYIYGHVNGPPVNEPNEDAPLCACGCSQPVKWSKITKKWNRYIYHHSSKKIYLDPNEKAPLCKCGCGQHVERSKVPPYDWNIYVNNHHNKDTHIKWKKRNPSGYKKHFHKMAVKGGLLSHKKRKVRDPKKYFENQSKISKEFHKKNPNFASENSKRIHKMYPDLGLRCYEGRIKNSPWSFMGVGFGSRQESDIAKLRFQLIGIIPIKGENCHIQIKRNEFDFEQLGTIHEHHPYVQPFKKSMLVNEYYKKRREILNGNGHKKSQLVVTTTVEQAYNMYKWLADKLELNNKNINIEVIE